MERAARHVGERLGGSGGYDCGGCGELIGGGFGQVGLRRANDDFRVVEQEIFDLELKPAPSAWAQAAPIGSRGFACRSW
jgi:hypothetical protein